MRHLLIAFCLATVLFSCSKEGADAISDRSAFSSTGEGGSADPGDPNGPGQIEPGQLTAGEWSDLKNWDFWNHALAQADFSGMPAKWGYNLSDRYSVHVANASDVPMVNVKVELIDANDQILWVSQTDNLGTAELWPRLRGGVPGGPLTIRIDGSNTFAAIPYSQGVNEITYQTGPANGADIAFIVDATGSMGDELSYLQSELVDVINEVESNQNGATINTAAVFYRDQNDDYLTRKSDFSSTVGTTASFIQDQQAAGGGDYPEAVHDGLREGISALQWSTNTRARIAFLLLDAPPHEEEQIKAEIKALVDLASQKGIKIIPVLASGGNKDTEFLLRYMAIATNSTYTFITDHSGIGNDHIEPSIGDYQVEYLNDLMVRLINQWMN